MIDGALVLPDTSLRHDRGIGDIQPLDAAHAQPGVAHRHRRPIPSARCRPGDRSCPPALGSAARARRRRPGRSGSDRAPCGRQAAAPRGCGTSRARPVFINSTSRRSLRKAGSISGATRGIARRKPHRPGLSGRSTQTWQRKAVALHLGAAMILEHDGHEMELDVGRGRGGVDRQEPARFGIGRRHRARGDAAATGSPRPPI